jgi:fatty acid desaturase
VSLHLLVRAQSIHLYIYTCGRVFPLVIFSKSLLQPDLSRTPSNMSGERVDFATLPEIEYPAFLYLLGTIPALLLATSQSFFQGWKQHGLTAAYMVICIPILEYFVGESSAKRGRKPERKVQQGTVHSLRDSPSFRAVLLLHCIISIIAFAGSLAMSAHPSRAPRGFLQSCLYVVSLSAVGIHLLVAGHELIHKVDRRSAVERSLGWFIMSFMLNPAYGVDHHFHHMYVGTDKDSATALRGQTFYSFFLRMESMSWAHAFRASALGDATKAKTLPFVPGCDRFINGVALSAVSVTSIVAFLGLKPLAYYVLGCFMATMFLDCANYGEHYGLVRRVGSNGELEPVGFQHSWDTTNPVSNLIFQQVGGHAAHHLHGSLPYPELDLGRGPVLPYGLVTMNLLGLIPPLFFRVVHPVLDQLEMERKRA